MASIPDKQPPAPAAVRVYLRVRPLIPEEQGHDSIVYEVHDDDDGDGDAALAHRSATFRIKLPDRGSRPLPNGAFARPPPLLRHRRERFEEFGGLAAVLREDCRNEAAYRATAMPLVDPVVSRNESACVFTYGHTGSGKSHTLLGGRGDQSGLYRFASAEMLGRIRARDPDGCLLVKATELYGDRVVCLLTGQPCTVRQDGKGRVRVRGPMVQDDRGRIERLPIGKLCRTPEEVVECVEAACESRRVGTSTHHDQSSRSHLVLELEVVTPALMEQRRLVLRQDAHLTRLKWLQTERTFNKHQERPMPKWTEDYSSTKIVRKEIKQYQTLVQNSRTELSQMSEDLGGTLVFCDLAGNEYARDSADSTEEEREEAARINGSLLAVKEMIRSLGRRERGRREGRPMNDARGDRKQHHVPYRDSKLTMFLKRHLETRAVMLAHVSPSAESLKKTVNTLKYSSAVVGGDVAPHRPGKENKKH